jgi:hypothetical protein
MPGGGGPEPGAIALVRYFRVTVTPALQNPIILTLDSRPDGGLALLKGQLQVVRGAARLFDLDRARQTVTRFKDALEPGGPPGLPGPGLPGGGPKIPPGGIGPAGSGDYVTVLQPTRLVVISATFPYKQELEEFRKALRLKTVADLFNHQDTTPRFQGLRVERREIQADGAAGPWQPLDLEGPKSAWRALLSAARGFAPEDFQQLDKVIVPGLAAPRPWLENGKYPPVDLPGIPRSPEELDAGPGKKPGILPGGPLKPGGGMFPGKGSPAEGPLGERKTAPQSWKELPRDYAGPETASQAKFRGEINVFDVQGLSEVAPENLGPGFGPQPPGLKPPVMKPLLPNPGNPFDGAGSFKFPEKCLVRFVDVEVQPGRTYQYRVRVRMANPNFGKKEAVAEPQFAAGKVLESAAVVTAPVTVSPEVTFYAVDQALRDGKKWKTAHEKGADLSPPDAEKVAVQIHKWVDEVQHLGVRYTVADWLIAERLLVRRGEYIGGKVEVEIPAWFPAKDTFDLLSASKGKAPPKKSKNSPSIDFATDQLLVDFTGGPGSDAAGKNPSADGAAVELLILSPDGKLRVRSSRHDGTESEARHATWRQRLEALRHPSSPTKPGPFDGGQKGPGGN